MLPALTHLKLLELSSEIYMLNGSTKLEFKLKEKAIFKLIPGSATMAKI
jgi:hypothetical protein